MPADDDRHHGSADFSEAECDIDTMKKKYRLQLWPPTITADEKRGQGAGKGKIKPTTDIADGDQQQQSQLRLSQDYSIAV